VGFKSIPGKENAMKRIEKIKELFREKLEPGQEQGVRMC
jgi:hypothetical protein